MLVYTCGIQSKRAADYELLVLLFPNYTINEFIFSSNVFYECTLLWTYNASCDLLSK